MKIYKITDASKYLGVSIILTETSMLASSLERFYLSVVGKRLERVD